jgi:hypothetical protein
VSDTTAPVSIVVLRVDRLRGTGRLVALADVEFSIAGVAVQLHGIRIGRPKPGIMVIDTPTHRAPTGEAVRSVLLPADLWSAISGLVLDAFEAP